MRRLNKLRLPTVWLAWVGCWVVALGLPDARAAQQQEAGAPLIVTDAWVRATPGSDVASAYLTLRNVSTKPVTLIAVDSSVASMAMIHETRTEGGISRMRPHEQLVIPPGKTVKLEPGGLHVMLHGIAHPLAPGASVPLVLRLSNGTSLQIVALVRPLNAQ
jgi:periplasmic copper chaperone A